MNFDQDNAIVQLCAKGMALEGKGAMMQAAAVFEEAWAAAVTDVEKFIAAHYLARHQQSVADKLTWDQTALAYALKIEADAVVAVLPSLYLNIGKCYEELQDAAAALMHYRIAQSYMHHLPEDGYGKMIRSGIEAGIHRVH